MGASARGRRVRSALQSLLSRALGRASELSLLRVLASRASRGCSAAAGSTWVNPPQASDSLDAIAALFRVSSGVGLCAARLGDDDRASRRANARARPSPRTSIQKNSYPLSFLRFRVLLVARATPEAPPRRIRRRETPFQRAPSRASARRARRGAALERARSISIFFSRDASATTAPSRARVAECRGALARVRGARHEVETPDQSRARTVADRDDGATRHSRARDVHVRARGPGETDGNRRVVARRRLDARARRERAETVVRRRRRALRETSRAPKRKPNASRAPRRSASEETTNRSKRL